MSAQWLLSLFEGRSDLGSGGRVVGRRKTLEARGTRTDAVEGGDASAGGVHAAGGGGRLVGRWSVRGDDHRLEAGGQAVDAPGTTSVGGSYNFECTKEKR